MRLLAFRKRLNILNICKETECELMKDLQEQKRRIEADAIVDAYLKSGKTLDEIMTFLKP